MSRPAYSKAERAARWKKLQGYIKRTTTLPEAIKLARSENVSAPTSAWLTAFSKMLEDRDES